MIKVFRKIRQNLLTENKFSKYLLYAIGEIVLVVIGILIALMLNTKKELNNNRTQIEDILKGISTNLENDMKNVNEVIKYTIIYDTVAKNILAKKLTASDYEGEIRNNDYIYLTRGTIETIHFESNAYNRLMANIEIIPEDYFSIVELLQNVYNRDVPISSGVEIELKDYLIEIEDKLRTTYSWYSGTDSSHYKKQIDYYLSNPQYFNDVLGVQKHLNHLHQHLLELKESITVAYNIIHKELISDTPFSEHIEQFEISEPEELMEYLGKYKTSKNKSNPSFLDSLTITSKDYFLDISPFDISILAQTKDEFQSPRLSDFQIHFYRDKDGEVNSLDLFLNSSATKHKDSIRSFNYQKIK